MSRTAGRPVITADVAVAVDGPTLFLQGTLAVLGIVALLLIAERSIEPGGPFVAQAAITVGGEADRRQASELRRHRGLPADPVRARPA